MRSHPAYPSPAELRAERDAAARDRADLETLARARIALGTALHALSGLDPLRHPDARWGIEDATETLRDMLRDLDGEVARCGAGRPVVNREDA